MSNQLEYIGWSSFVFTDEKGTRMMTDPFMSGNDSYKIVPSPVDPKNIVVDFIICSHCSDDHYRESNQIMSNSPTTKFVGDLGSLALLDIENKVYSEQKRTELITAGAAYQQGKFTITALSARHIAFRSLPNGTFLTGEPMCYIIEIENGPTVFFGGDTSLTYDMKLWGELYKPDIAIVGIGGADLNGRTLSELSPKTASYCVQMLGAKKTIPMHYSKESDLVAFKSCMATTCPDCEVIAMKAKDKIEL